MVDFLSITIVLLRSPGSHHLSLIQYDLWIPGTFRAFGPLTRALNKIVTPPFALSTLFDSSAFILILNYSAMSYAVFLKP